MDEDQIDYWEGEIKTSIVAANEQVDACPQEEVDAFTIICQLARKFIRNDNSEQI